MRRLQGRALVAGLAIALLTLAGCSAPAAEPATVTVSGEPGAAPTITYLTPLQVDTTRTEQIWPGTGAELVEGAPVLIDFWLEDATDASLVKESYSTNPTAMLLTEEDLGTDLYETLRGQQVGARMLQISPGSGAGATDYPTVTVVDVLPTRADGEAVPPRADLPAVTLDASGAPSITPTGTEPPTTLVAQPLIRGTGEQVGRERRRDRAVHRVRVDDRRGVRLDVDARRCRCRSRCRTCRRGPRGWSTSRSAAR